MAYCTLADLQGTYGSPAINAWSRMDAAVVQRAITDAGAEIDGYLMSGGYAVPLDGPPATITKYCIDIAAANLIVGVGILKDDPGGMAVVEQAKTARRYLARVAEGKFRIPGYSDAGKSAAPPTGNVRVSARDRLNLEGY